MSPASTTTENPFPRKTVITDSIDRVPFYPSVAFKEAETKLKEWIRRFATEKDWTGAAIGLRGRFGTGKTHTCLRLVQSFERKELIDNQFTNQPANQPAGKAIYAKAQTANRLDFYKNYVGQNLHQDDLRRLVSAHILVVLRKQAPPGKESLPGTAEQKLSERIADEPEIGLEFLKQDLLPASDLLQSLQRDVEVSEREIAADFCTAYSRIAHPLLGKLAIQWLQGGMLEPGEMRDLGVKLAGLDKPEQAFLVLRFLLDAFRRAERPFLLCIDEHERITSRSKDEDAKASWGLLKDLAEAFTGTGHLLIVSGMSDAWDSLPDDVYARIRREDIIEVALERSEAPKLLKAYAPDLDKIFSQEALKRLYDVSQNNNARRLLDLAHQAYKSWDGSRPLNPEVLRDVTRSALGDRNRKASLADSIEKCSDALSLGHERDVEFGGIRFDFVLSSTEGRRILVQVSESAFLLDEIDHSREIIDSQKKLATERSRVRTCVIMIGYSSLVVRDALEKVVDRVLTYEEAKFLEEFKEFGERAMSDMRSTEPLIPVPQIADATRILDRTEKARLRGTDRVATALEEASAPQQHRQQELLARQADEQMAGIIRDLQSALLQEGEHLLRVTSLRTDVRRDERADTTLWALARINEQHEGMRRARSLSARERADGRMGLLLDQFLRAVAGAEDKWHELIDQNGDTDDEVETRIRELVARRRRLLHEIEDRWLHRGAWPPWIIHSLMAAPFVLAIALIAWMGMNYATLSAARGQAFRSLQAPLVDVINFTLKYPTADYQAGDFVSAVLPLEQALLNPAISRDKNLKDLRAAIDRVRRAYCLSGANCKSPTSPTLPPRPNREEVEALHSAAAKYLDNTYSSSFAGEYFGGQTPMLTAIVMLVILGISLLWWQPLLAAKFGASPGGRQYHIQGS